jgi:hypothetical protein
MLDEGQLADVLPPLFDVVQLLMEDAGLLPADVLDTPEGSILFPVDDAAVAVPAALELLALIAEFGRAQRGAALREASCGAGVGGAEAGRDALTKRSCFCGSI